MNKRTFTIKNRSASERILHDASGKAITFAAGQEISGVELMEGHANELQARGGSWVFSGTSGGDGKRVQARTQAGEGLGTKSERDEDAGGAADTNQGADTGTEDDRDREGARALIDRADDMSWDELKEAAKEFLGETGLPRGKAKMLEALEEYAGSAD